MFIPIEFQKFFQQTLQPAFKISAAYDENPELLGSRLGGAPYWETEQELLCDNRGAPMALLAQINFADVPNHELLPQSGILQIFIPKNHEYYGANLEELTGPAEVKSRFWSNPNAENSAPIQDDITEDDLVPVFGAHSISFTACDDVAGIETVECAEAMGKNPFEVLEDVALNEKEETMFFDAITEYTASHGHKLLGYPGFINGDPRENTDYRLLLQIDTDMDGNNDIMWGDNGIAQIFILEKDLRAGRFDNICLFWDCA